MGFCEGSLGFDFPLGVAAISQFLFTPEQLQADVSSPIRLFQKALKYGVPHALAVSAYEFGIADRMLATGVSQRLAASGYQGYFFSGGLADFRHVIDNYLDEFPSYYGFVMESA